MITVAIPAYNGSAFIEEAVNSVLNQTYRVEGIIIIDDYSTDSTVEKAREVIRNNSDRKINLVLNERNIGYQANWNKCIELCTSRYLIILHQDDMLRSFSCERLISFLKENPELALAGGREEICNVSGRPPNRRHPVKPDRIFERGRIFEFVTEESSYIPCSSVMFDLDKIRQVGGFDIDVSATDELYWPRVLTKFPIAILGAALILRRSHPEQAEYFSFIEDEKRALVIFRRFRAISMLEERAGYRRRIITFQRKKFFVGYIGTISVYLARIRYIGLSFRYLFKAFRIYPAGFYLLPVLWKPILKIVYYMAKGMVKKKDF